MNLRSGYGSADFDRTHVFNANFGYTIPSPYGEHTLAGKFTAGWKLNGLITLMSGQPYSVIDFSGAVGSLYFSSYDGITNPVVPLAPGVSPKQAMTGKSGAFLDAAGNPIPALDSTKFTLPLITPSGTVTAADTAAFGVPGVTVDAPNGDPYETTFTTGQRNIFRQSSQKRADISLVKVLAIKDNYKLRYTFDVFNLTNHASFDIPTAEITQNQNYNPTPAADQPLLQAGNDYSFYNPPTSLGVVQHTIGSPRQIQMSLAVSF